MRGRAVADDGTRRAEVNEHRRALRRQQDIGRLHIAVVNIVAVQVLQRAEQGAQNGQQPRLGNNTGSGRCLLQLLTAHPGHHVIGRPQRLEGPKHFHNVGVIELSQQLGFVHKAIEVLSVFLQFIVRVGGQNSQTCSGSHSAKSRQVFLYHDLFPGTDNLCQISDTETTLPD